MFPAFIEKFVLVDMVITIKRMYEYPQARDAWVNESIPFFSRHWLWLTAMAVGYCPVVFGLKYYMMMRKPFKLRRPLQVWNFWMFIFSLGLAIPSFPSFFKFAFTIPLWEMVCSDWAMRQNTHVAVTGFLFNFLKWMEFGDSLFIVLRKRPLILLHWYHHVATMLFCWLSNQNGHLHNSGGTWFFTMNAVVHTFMYFYYWLRSCGYRPRWDFYITLMQLSQMFVGTAVMIWSCFCEHLDLRVQVFGLMMYASYIYFFLDIMLKRYFFKTAWRGQAVPKPEKAQAKTD